MRVEMGRRWAPRERAVAEAPLPFAGERLFLPISLGNHFYTNGVLTCIAREVVPGSLAATVFLCDRLRSIIFRMRGVEAPGLAERKAAHELAQFKRTLRNCGLREAENVRIADWSLVGEDPRFLELLGSLRRTVEDEADNRRFLETLCSRLVGRFVREFPPSEAACALQRSYVYEETALSIFMTEVYGANVEVYRRKDEGLIRFLYEEKPDLLRRLLGRSELKRRFVSLEALFGGGEE